MSVFEFLFEVFKILVGGLVGFLTGWHLFNKRIDIEAQRDHLNRLREQVVEPMLEALKDEKLGYKPDRYISLGTYGVTAPKIGGRKEFSQILFEDLVENHYPTLYKQFKSYVEKSEELKKKEQQRDEKAIGLVERELKKAGLQYERNPRKISKEKIVNSSSLASWLLHFIKHRRGIKGSGINVAIETAVSRYEVRVGDRVLYFTGDEGKAEKVNVQLERIVLDYADNEEFKLMLKELDEAYRERREEEQKLIIYLGMLRETTKLKVIKERLICVKCPYIKSARASPFPP